MEYTDGSRQTVYIETSVVSYFTGRPSRDLVMAGRQEITRECWPMIAQHFDRYISALVIQEASRGDPGAAEQRLDALRGIPVLSIDETTEGLASALIRQGPIPEKYPEDALHIAVAAANGIDYLVTWNFKHINNAQMKFGMRRVIEDRGLECPVICTPDELVGEEE